jgi:hypothetical protein
LSTSNGATIKTFDPAITTALDHVRQAKLDPSEDLVIVGSSLIDEWATIKFDGTNGQLLWVTNASPPGTTRTATDLSFAPDGSVLVGGGYSPAGNYLSKCDSAGVPKWFIPASACQIERDHDGDFVLLDHGSVTRVLDQVGSESCAAVPNSTGSIGRFDASTPMAAKCCRKPGYTCSPAISR